MMAERIENATESPVVGVGHRYDLLRASRHGPSTHGRGVFHQE